MKKLSFHNRHFSLWKILTICIACVFVMVSCQKNEDTTKNMEDFKPMAAAFRLDDDALCNQFNSFLKEIKANGVYNEIMKRWTTGDVVNATMPDIRMPSSGTPLRIGTMGSDFPAPSSRTANGPASRPKCSTASPSTSTVLSSCTTTTSAP